MWVIQICVYIVLTEKKQQESRTQDYTVMLKHGRVVWGKNSVKIKNHTLYIMPVQFNHKGWTEYEYIDTNSVSITESKHWCFGFEWILTVVLVDICSWDVWLCEAPVKCW